MMKVKCRECIFEENGKCTKKKVSINKNKGRRCDNYEFSDEKDIAILESKARVMDKQDAAYRRKVEIMKSYEQLNNAHPVTGDLSRFKSSAT